MSRKRRSAADEPFFLVRTAASNHRDGAIEEHVHGWHQLVYVAQGLITVRTEAGSWIAPPRWAVWVPAGTRHAIRFVGESLLRTCYLRPGWRDALPVACAAMIVSPLLRALVLRAGERGMLDERDEHEHAIALLIRGELGDAAVPPLALPQPASAVLRRAAA